MCQASNNYNELNFSLALPEEIKNCATLAGSKTSPAITIQSKPVSPLASNGSAALQKSAALDTVQIAKLIVQQIPQFQAALQSNNTVSNVPSVPAPPSNNPFAVNLPKSGNTFNISTSVSSVPAAPNLPVSVDPVDCAIPGCGKPIHVNGAA
ncbi:hypothetical protein C8J56DRAFT_1088211 [Mycena floridula]|nr:hypothetical protein C8J56DRAFT_1088211 [Mycena floridula]